jgi:hypothetical protein
MPLPDFQNKDIDFILDDILLIIRYSIQVLLFIAKLCKQSAERRHTQIPLTASALMENQEFEIEANSASVIHSEKTQSMKIKPDGREIII